MPTQLAASAATCQGCVVAWSIPQSPKQAICNEIIITMMVRMLRCDWQTVSNQDHVASAAAAECGTMLSH